MHTVSVALYELYRRIFCLSYTHTDTGTIHTHALRTAWRQHVVPRLTSLTSTNHEAQDDDARMFNVHSFCTKPPTVSTCCVTLHFPACLFEPPASSVCCVLQQKITIKKVKWRTLSAGACASPRFPPSGHSVTVLYYLIDPVGTVTSLELRLAWQAAHVCVLKWRSLLKQGLWNIELFPLLV